MIDAELQRYDRVQWRGGGCGDGGCRRARLLGGQLVCVEQLSTRSDYGCAAPVGRTGRTRIDGLKVGEYRVEFGSGQLDRGTATGRQRPTRHERRDAGQARANETRPRLTACRPRGADHGHDPWGRDGGAARRGSGQAVLPTGSVLRHEDHLRRRDLPQHLPATNVTAFHGVQVR